MRSRSSVPRFAIAFAFAIAVAVPFEAPVASAQGAPPEAKTPEAKPHEELDAQRERFRAGLERYKAGAFGDAILIWEPIYAELGPEKGYRLAFNLGRAYEQFGNPTRAAESYEGYVREVARRRDAGEQLEENVAKQEAEAKERLAQLDATQGRIRIAGDRAVVVKIDGGSERLAPTSGFVAYVTPDRMHTVTFDPGTKDEKQISVKVERGQRVEVTAPELAPLPPRVEAPPPSPPPPAPRFEVREEKPFGKNVLYVAAGVTAVSIVVPVVLYANASSIKDDFDAAVLQASDPSAYTAAEATGTQKKSDYLTARDTAYASLAIPAVLGAATIGLTAYWLFGAKETRVPITAGILPGGAAIGASTRF